MDDNIKKIIKDRFDSLPKSIQEIILSTHYEETLIEIGQQYQLNMEKVRILERETTMVLLGLTNIKNFESELVQGLPLDELKIPQIVEDINEKIFLNVWDLLKLMNTPIGEEPILEDMTEEKIRPHLAQAFDANSNPETEKPKSSDPELDGRFDKLSDATKKIISESGYHRTLYAIATEHKLNIAKMGELERNTTKMIIGDIHPGEFEEVIKNSLGLPDEETATLVSDINERILKKIREKLVGTDVYQANAPVQASAPKIEKPKSDTQILNDAGIEILSNKEEAVAP